MSATDEDATPTSARNPRLEAQAVAGSAFEARVLEPSPPAVADGEWLADDPTVAEHAVADQATLSPVAGPSTTWAEWLQDHPEHREWADLRWLGGGRRLPAPPATFTATRSALHRLAVYVVAPARRRANGKFGLRWTLGGFGTPFFGTDEQIRVEGTRLVRQRGDRATTVPIGSLSEAASFALDGPPDAAWADGFDVPGLGDPDASLPVDAVAASFLGDWYGFAFSVLEQLRAGPASIDPSRVQVWPEHFDAAFDNHRADDQRRITFGASPGDANTTEPYLYVIPPPRADAVPAELWNAQGFHGAALTLSEFVHAPDPRAAALQFFLRYQTLLER